jgi:hypothetical protein
MTGDCIPPELEETRHGGAALRHPRRAAWMEWAAGRRVEGVLKGKAEPGLRNALPGSRAFIAPGGWIVHA